MTLTLEQLVGKVYVKNTQEKTKMLKERTAIVRKDDDIVTPEMLPSHDSVRHVKPHSMLTMDYRPARLNVVTNDGGVISRAFYG